MTTFSYADCIAIGLIAVYTPVLLLSIFLCIRHSFGRSAGWSYLVLFSILRLVGGACELIATHGNLTSSKAITDVFIAFSIVSSVGLSPLLLVTIAQAKRLSDTIFPNRDGPVSVVLNFHILDLITMGGLIFAVVGGVNSGSSITSPDFTEPKTSIVGSVLFIVAFVGLAAVTVVLALQLSQVSGQAANTAKLVLGAIVLSLPLLAVRVAYEAIAVLGNNHNFSPVSGNQTIYLCMALIEELIIVLIAIACGLAIRDPPSGVPAGNAMYSNNNGNNAKHWSDNYSTDDDLPYHAEANGQYNMSSLPQGPAPGQGQYPMTAQAPPLAYTQQPRQPPQQDQQWQAPAMDSEDRGRSNARPDMARRATSTGVGSKLGALGKRTLVGKAITAMRN